MSDQPKPKRPRQETERALARTAQRLVDLVEKAVDGMAGQESDPERLLKLVELAEKLEGLRQTMRLGRRIEEGVAKGRPSYATRAPGIPPSVKKTAARAAELWRMEQPDERTRVEKWKKRTPLLPPAPPGGTQGRLTELAGPDADLPQG